MPFTPEDPSHPILIIGASGMLGKSWARECVRNNLPWEGPTRRDLDLQNPKQLKTLSYANYSAVINCAAWTDVDAAEDHQSDADFLNREVPTILARCCQKHDVPFLHYSTDYVFSGYGSTPYKPDTPIEPQSVYGKTKADGEVGVASENPNALIVRTSWLYAPWGKNFVRTILKLADEKEAIQVVDDQTGTPTCCHHLARTSLKLLNQKKNGIWHVTDGGSCTWHDFAKEAVARSGVTCDVRPCSTELFPTKATRPSFSVLDTSETEKTTGEFPGWKINLRPLIPTVEDNHE